MFLAPSLHSEVSTGSAGPKWANAALNRRELLLRSSGIGIPAGLLAACGPEDSTTERMLSVGATDWLPNDSYVEDSLGSGLPSRHPTDAEAVPTARAPISRTENLAEAIAAGSGEAGFEVTDGVAYQQAQDQQRVVSWNRVLVAS